MTKTYHPAVCVYVCVDGLVGVSLCVFVCGCVALSIALFFLSSAYLYWLNTQHTYSVDPQQLAVHTVAHIAFGVSCCCLIAFCLNFSLYLT